MRSSSSAQPPSAVLGNNSAFLERGAARLGVPGNRIRRNVRDCQGAARCNQGCPTARRQSMNVSYVPRAVAAGARVYATCRAQRVVLENGRAAAVEGEFVGLLGAAGRLGHGRVLAPHAGGARRVPARDGSLVPRFDVVLLDTGAGISDVVLFAVSLASEVLLVVTPEPTSLTDAYATIKVLVGQQKRQHIRMIVNQVGRQGEGRVIRGQLQLVVDRYVTRLMQDPSVPFKLELLGEIPPDAAVRERCRSAACCSSCFPAARRRWASRRPPTS